MASTFATFEAEIAAAEAARQVAVTPTASAATVAAAEKKYRAAVAVAGRNWGRQGLARAMLDHGEDLGATTGGGGWKDKDA